MTMTQLNGGNVPLFTRDVCLSLCQYLVKRGLLSVPGVTNALAYHSGAFGLDRKSVEDGAKLFMSEMVSRSSNMQLGVSIGDFVRQWLAETATPVPSTGFDMGRTQAKQVSLPAVEPAKKQIVGPYEILKSIGEGGMGAVHLARHRQIASLMAAIKMIKPEMVDPEMAQRFCREAEVLITISHPNLVRGYTLDMAGTVPYIAMEYIEGTTLDKASRPGDDLLWCVKTLAAACRGVNSMHERGLIHRDLKPENIFVDRVGVPKVGDPGMVKKRGQDELDEEGVILGSTLYMAPEQVNGDNAAITPAADVYALVKILFYLLTGTYVHFEKNRMMLMAAILDKEIPAVVVEQLRRKVSKRRGFDRLLAIVLKGLQFEPKDRYQTAGELADVLEAHADWLQNHEEEDLKRQKAEHEAMRKRFRLIAGIAASGLLTTILALLATIYFAKAKKAEARAAQEARGRESEALARVAAEANARRADALRLGVAVDFTEAQVLVKAALWAEAETALLVLIERDPQFAPGRRLLAEVQFNQQNPACVRQWEWLAEHGPALQRVEAAFFTFFTCQQVTVVEPNEQAKRLHQDRLRRYLDAVADEPYKTLGEVAFSISTAEDLFRDRKVEEGKAELANGVHRLEDMDDPGRLVWLSDYIQGFLLQTQALIASREQAAGSRERSVLLYNEARAKFEASSAVNADFPLSHFYLADVLNQLGEPRAAMASFQRVQRLMPYHAPARYMHAECLSELGLREQNPAEQTRFANRALLLCRQVEEMNRVTNPRQPVQCGRAKVKALILKIGASLRSGRQGLDEARAELQRTIESMRSMPALNDMDRAVLQNAEQVLTQSR